MQEVARYLVITMFVIGYVKSIYDIPFGESNISKNILSGAFFYVLLYLGGFFNVICWPQITYISISVTVFFISILFKILVEKEKIGNNKINFHVFNLFMIAFLYLYYKGGFWGDINFLYILCIPLFMTVVYFGKKLEKYL